MNSELRRFVFFLSVALLLAGGSAHAQSTARHVAPLLKRRVLESDVVTYQLPHYLMQRVTRLPAVPSAKEWTLEAERIRKEIVENVVYHGWPREWMESAPKFEDLGVFASGEGYRVRKLRYEIVPGFYSTALLYEPTNPRGKAPGIVNVNGHVYLDGKATEYKQKRCINQAKRGIYALNLEWLACGELNHPENAHMNGAHLDLVGRNSLGLFFLAMRRGVDYLAQHPDVDSKRLGVTGLSGGSWQTITLSSLDPRVKVSIPVAGYTSLIHRLEHFQDPGDREQNATDLLRGRDYTHLTAIRAPRPTLLIYNAEDDCCFRAPLAKPHIYELPKPFFDLYQQEGIFEWHENTDPGTHNYHRDNREQAYRFFTKHFGLPIAEQEIPVSSEVKSYDELVVGLPKDNLTILGLARKLAGEIRRAPVPSGQAARAKWAAAEREKLKDIIRYQPVKVAHLWGVDNTKNTGVETLGYRFEMSNDMMATGIWLKAIRTPEGADLTVVLDDQGREHSVVVVSDQLNRGEQVLALDTVLHGDASPDNQDHRGTFSQWMEVIGERALGHQAAQLLEISRWWAKRTGAGRVRLESSGIRSQVLALVASALEPELFSEVVVRDGMRSMGYLLEKPVAYDDAPELFCLDLYKEFDVDRLAELAGPTRVSQKYLAAGSQ